MLVAKRPLCKVATLVKSIIAKSSVISGLLIGQVAEMLQVPGSDSELLQRPNLFLLTLYQYYETVVVSLCVV